MTEPPENRIFFIGPNKCGTTSLHHLLDASGVRSAHWSFPDGRPLASIMMANIGLNRRPFEGYEDYVAFSDMHFLTRQTSIEGHLFFRQIHAAYRDAFFVLSTRPVEAWLRSRQRHETKEGGKLIDRLMAVTGLPEAGIIEGWRRMFETHCHDVRQYFAGHTRFMEFDIEADSPDKLAEFLSPVYEIEVAHWGQRNPTSARAPDHVAPSKGFGLLKGLAKTRR